MLKKMTRKLKGLIVLPIAEWLIKHNKLDFYQFYYYIRVSCKNIMQGMSYDKFIKWVQNDYKVLKNYPECYRWANEAALLAWKFYNT